MTSQYIHGGDHPGMIRSAQKALRHARKFVVENGDCEIRELTSAMEALDVALQALPLDATSTVQEPSR
jgi:hypothetical protein